MRLLLVDIGFALLMAAAGGLAGWWLRGRSAPGANRRALARQGAGEALTGLQQLAETVRHCVQEHTACIQAIEAELCEAGSQDPAALAKAAASLKAASGQAQGQFSGIRDGLDSHVQSLDQSLDHCRTLLLTSLSLDRQRQQYQKVLSSLQGLAGELSQDLDGCAAELQRIDEELESTSSSGDEIASAASQMLQATDGVHQRAVSVGMRLEQHAEELKMQAVLGHTDQVTALPNRSAFEKELGRRMVEYRRSRRPFTLLLFDLDGLTRINKCYGRDQGDATLEAIGSVLKSGVRGQSSVARYGGDELAVILTETTMAQALPVAERLRQAVANRPLRHGTRDYRVTVSIGIAQVVADEQPTATLERCMEALSVARQNGGNAGYWHDGRECHPVHTVYQQAVAANPMPAAAPVAPPPPPEDGHVDQTTVALADRDKDVPLSGRSVFLANLKRRIAEWRRGGSNVSVLLGRVDQHEALVARFGPQAQEFLRKVTGRVLESVTRDMDECCDYDEQTFALLLPGGDDSTAQRVAQRLKSQMSECRLKLNNESFKLSASVGLANCTEQDTAMDILMRAENQLQQAATQRGSPSAATT